MDYIETFKLEKNFPGVKAIDGIDLVIKTGEVHAMVGANGTGKSTFAKVISGVFSVYILVY
ncbi:ATP-binding cassette domain-containing protein [bacterium]|nr:ATP-binding cassette domain-containing protein [bacterium]